MASSGQVVDSKKTLKIDRYGLLKPPWIGGPPGKCDCAGAPLNNPPSLQAASGSEPHPPVRHSPDPAVLRPSNPRNLSPRLLLPLRNIRQIRPAVFAVLNLTFYVEQVRLRSDRLQSQLRQSVAVAIGA